jgi:hypothetical protein
MMTRPALRLMFLSLALLIFLAAATAVAAANTVPSTAMGDSTRGITPNDLKPSAVVDLHREPHRGLRQYQRHAAERSDLG